MVVYETEDPAFADSAIAGAYRTGGSLARAGHTRKSWTRNVRGD